MHDHASRTTTSRTLFLGSLALRCPLKDNSGRLGPMRYDSEDSLLAEQRITGGDANPIRLPGPCGAH
jgi:hypothetical protein